MPTSSPQTSRPLVLVELLAIYLGVPLAVWWQWLPVPLIVLPLYVVAAYAGLWLLQRGGYRRRQLWFGDDPVAERAFVKIILWRFVAVIVVVGAVVSFFYPQKLFVLPLQHPFIWLLIILLYPPLSVYPQELLYRGFFFARYGAIFPEAGLRMAASTLFFVFMHIVFNNGIAILCTLIGGFLFAHTYARTRSLRLVCLEHTLYGYAIFTLGLGEFFVFGEARALLS
jgi:membrane protease YdiL (CAAX protease family)